MHVTDEAIRAAARPHLSRARSINRDVANDRHPDIEVDLSVALAPIIDKVIADNPDWDGAADDDPALRERIAQSISAQIPVGDVVQQAEVDRAARQILPVAVGAVAAGWFVTSAQDWPMLVRVIGVYVIFSASTRIVRRVAAHRSR